MSAPVVYRLPTPKTDVSQESKQALAAAKILLVRKIPFIGFMVMTSRYIFTEEVPTMAATTVGENTIYINEEFLLKVLKDEPERAFVLAHEIMHIFLMHIGRQIENSYNQKLWNVATDFVINAWLVEMGKNINDIKMPEFGLYDAKHYKKSADQVYHELLKESGNDPKKAAAKYGAFDIDMEGEGSGEGEEGEGTGGGNGKPNPSRTQQRPFDEVSSAVESDAKKLDNKQKIAASLSGASEESLKQIGQGAVDLVRQFREFLESKIPWSQVLQDFITASSRQQYTYSRLSRRSTNTVVFPSMTGNFISVVFGIDTSGSMSHRDLTEALSELKGVVEQFDAWEVTLVSCDTYAHVIGEYSSEEGDDFTSIDKGMIGGGGTDMQPIAQFANDMDEPPNACIIITDGYIPESSLDNEIDEVPTIVVVTSEGNENLNLDRARVIQINNHRYTKDSDY